MREVGTGGAGQPGRWDMMPSEMQVSACARPAQLDVRSGLLCRTLAI